VRGPVVADPEGNRPDCRRRPADRSKTWTRWLACSPDGTKTRFGPPAKRGSAAWPPATTWGGVCRSRKARSRIAVPHYFSEP